MRLLPTLTARGAFTRISHANAAKHCYSSGTQTRFRCKWCNLPYESLDNVRHHARKVRHAGHFQPMERYKPSYYCVEDTY